MTTDKQFRVGGKAVRTRDADEHTHIGDTLTILDVGHSFIYGRNFRTRKHDVWLNGSCTPIEDDQPLSARVTELEAENAKLKAELAAKDRQFKVGGKAVRTRDACIDATLGDVLDITSMNKFAIGGINQRTDTWQVWSPGQCEPAESPIAWPPLPRLLGR